MRKLSILIIALLFLTSVSALELVPEYSSNIIVKDFQNSIQLNLEIKNATPGTYNLYTLADISIKPSETFQVTNKTFQKEFTISPTENLNLEGYYAFTYILNHRGVEKVEEKMLLNIVNLEDIIEISSESIDPASGNISFYVQNKEAIYLKNLTAKFSSVLFETEEIIFDLKPNEKLEIAVDVNEDKLKKTKAGVYIINSIFQMKDGEREIKGNLYLGEKKGITSTEDKSGLLIRSETITKVNSGNVIESIQVKLSRNIFSRLFTSFNIEPTLTERKGLTVEYTWLKEKLNPTEAYIVKAKTNYLFPFLIIILATLAFLGFKRFSETKLEIKKSVSPVKTKGGEFALKVQLALKAKKDIENVSLVDKVPAIVKIYKKFGSLKPDKIDATSRRIHWNIGDLKAGEERIFNYIIYSKVGVVGKFSLPRALAIFEKDNSIHEIDSNNVFFMNEQTRD
ncbi:hypothetical protein KAT36_02800 [Candidatus Pacearchaeota archaeon]|nr:hypothetical protein [Candidatus Pacearchaeota archaeon]